uniref:UspA domain-containing protein n=1 Tax=Aegilops tauschii subsp. strangulata TaxID=200361 RepID=A0A453IIZ9_AEGTS
MAGEGVGRCILVGLHMDAVGKELLQWALNQAARSGDRVVAVHIYRKSGRYPAPYPISYPSRTFACLQLDSW